MNHDLVKDSDHLVHCIYLWLFYTWFIHHSSTRRSRILRNVGIYGAHIGDHLFTILSRLIPPHTSYFEHRSPLDWLKTSQYLGLSFALSHTVHLIFIILLFAASETEEVLDATTLIFGGLEFVFVYLLALTSNDFAMCTLGSAVWKWLHCIGLNYLWFIFVVTMSGIIHLRFVTLVLFTLLILERFQVSFGQSEFVGWCRTKLNVVKPTISCPIFE